MGRNAAAAMVLVLPALLVVGPAPPAASDPPGLPRRPAPASLIAPPTPVPAPPGSRTQPLLVPLMERGLLPPEACDRLSRLPALPLAEALAAIDREAAAPACLPLVALDRPARPDSIDVLRYDLHFTDVDETDRTVRARAVLTVCALAPLTEFPLDFAGWRATSVSLAASPADSLFPVPSEASDSTLRIGPFPAAAPGDTLILSVDYTGNSPSCAGWGGVPGGFVFDPRGVHTFSEPDYARRWFPAHDVPWDKAYASITVDAPPGRVASATGVPGPGRVLANGAVRRTWTLDAPAATYLLALYLGDYVVVDESGPGGLPMEFHTYAEYEARTRETFAGVPDMIAFFSTFHPFPFARYGMSLGNFPGGMEHQTNTLIGYFYLSGTRQVESLFAHELAHQWWGDMITPASWRDVWLNEGFATYFDLLYSEHRYGWAVFRQRSAVMDSVYFAHPELDVPLLDPDPGDLFTFIVYNKGARVLDMLRGVSRLRLLSGPAAGGTERRAAGLEGDRRFFAIFTRYAAAHAYGNASSADFQRAAEAELGENLDWFFGRWLHTVGHPELLYDWKVERSDGAGVRLRVAVRQVQTGAPVFRMPIQVAYSSRDTELVEARALDRAAVEWTVDLPPGDWTVVPDPDDWLLDEHRRAALFPVLQGLRVVNNPSRGAFELAGTLEGDVPVPGVLRVFDASGRLVRGVNLGEVGPGPVAVAWDGRTGDGRAAPAGVYFARLDLGENRAIRKLVRLP